MLILVGPSASGKTQIVEQLIKEGYLKKVVTYTTRAKRPHEVEDRDYHFISKEDFHNKIDEEFFVEFVSYNGNYYGTAREDVKDDRVVILEPKGAMKYQDLLGKDVYVIFLRCSLEIRRLRMKKRGDSEDQIQKRLLLDKTIFSEKVKNSCDACVDTSGSNIYDNTKEVMDLYKEYLAKK